MVAAAQSAPSAALALSLWQSGKRQEAQRMCELLVSAADDADAVSLLAEMQVANGQPQQAVESLRRLARLRMKDASVRRRLGETLLSMEAFTEAVESYQESLLLEPGSVRAYNNIGRALTRLGRHADAIASYEQALRLDPRYAIGHNNLGLALHEQGVYELAIEHYARALEIDPSFAEAHSNLGNALQATKRYTEAVESYERALTLGGNRAEVFSDCGSALLSAMRAEEALPYCERAVLLKPDFAEAYNNLGGALRKLQRLDEAIAACERALEFRPGYATALSNIAGVMVTRARYEDAIEYCDRAIAQEPTLAVAHEHRATALFGAKRPAEAAAAYARVLEIEPDFQFARGGRLSARLACCDWTGYDEICADLANAVRAGKAAIQPFTLLSISADPELQQRCARIFADEQFPPVVRRPWSGARHTHDRIRVAYLSADFHTHATAMLTAGLFEAHDRKRFETIAISFGPDDGGDLRRRLINAFDRFVDVRNLSDTQVADLMRSLEIDIAVDLKGFTGDSRPGMLTRRGAPIQVSYLGYPGTLALREVDYVLADPIVLPPQDQFHYSEAVVYLPECYQVNDDRRSIAVHTPARAELGLPEEGFVFCCFNNNYKITPVVFDIWMRLLQQVPGSVLWLLEDNASAAVNLRREAQARGVTPDRLIFAPRVTVAQHLPRQRRADLFLDTWPYNAHTTTSDALWASLPVLTCLGTAFPGRVAASLLSAVGLPELITHSLDAYEARALELATDAVQLASLRARLAENRDSDPLFDTGRFCRHLEDAYTTMWRRHLEGLSPEGFSVAPLPRTPKALQVVTVT
jgi:protein O-GlcNAc transferase